jgi:hypothetical protein
MTDSYSPDPNLLRTILEPLLDDLQYWFTRSRTLLETEPIPFMADEQKTDLLTRVLTAQQEVGTMQTLLKVVDGQAGVDTSTLMGWHQLVHECWQVSVRLRSDQF